MGNNMNALLPNTQFPLNPGMGHGPMQQQQQMPTLDGFDWNALAGMGTRDQRSYVGDYAQQHPDLFNGGGNPFHQFMRMTRGWQPQMPQQQAQTPQMPGTQTTQAFPPAPVAPQGMVGQSYTVQGMTPATSPFGLPHY